MSNKSIPPGVISKAFDATVEITKSALLNRASTTWIDSELGELTSGFMEEIFSKLLDLYSSSLESSTSSS